MTTAKLKKTLAEGVVERFKQDRASHKSREWGALHRAIQEADVAERVEVHADGATVVKYRMRDGSWFWRWAGEAILHAGVQQ